MDHSILSLIVLTPLVGALVLALLPDKGKTMQWGALIVTLVWVSLHRTSDHSRVPLVRCSFNAIRNRRLRLLVHKPDVLRDSLSQARFMLAQEFINQRHLI